MSPVVGTDGGLGPALRALNLSGMLDTLEARLAEARAGTLGHVEFLQVLCQDELARRDAQKMGRRIKAAHFETDATVEGFDFKANPKLPAAQIRDLARLDFVAGGEGLLIFGPVGVGKSHLAQALGHQACRRGYDVIFAKTNRVLAELAGGHADRSFDTRLRRLAKPHVLVLDDFAMREFTATQADDLYDLLCERINRPGRALIVTSNRSPADWYPLFPNAVVGESILDRLINSSHHLLLDGHSYRPNRRPGRNPKTPPTTAHKPQRPGQRPGQRHKQRGWRQQQGIEEKLRPGLGTGGAIPSVTIMTAGRGTGPSRGCGVRDTPKGTPSLTPVLLTALAMWQRPKNLPTRIGIASLVGTGTHAHQPGPNSYPVQWLQHRFARWHPGLTPTNPAQTATATRRDRLEQAQDQVRNYVIDPLGN